MRLKLFFSALAVAAIALTGCNKQTELEINYGKTATLQGKVTIFDKDNSTSQVASKVKVYAEVAYADMISTTNPNGNKTFNTTTNEDGIYTFQLPVTETAYNNGIRLYTELKEIEGKFYIGEATVQNFSITPNDITYQNINMFSEDMEETVITVKGTVEISGTKTTSAKGFEVNASINSKTYKTTTNSDGEYVFQLPYMASGSVSITVPEQEVDGKTYIISSGGGTYASIDGSKLEYEANANITVKEQQ